MRAPEGYNHLGQEFWDRVEPDPDSSCWIFQTTSLHPGYQGKTLLVFLMGSPGGKNRHRACYRSKCVNPDHVVEGKYIPRPTFAPRPRKPWQFDRQYSQC